MKVIFHLFNTTKDEQFFRQVFTSLFNNNVGLHFKSAPVPQFRIRHSEFSDL